MRTHLLFLPGFVCPRGAYDAFLGAIRDTTDVAVTADDVAGSAVAQVTGRSTPEAEARALGDRARALIASGDRVVLGGHSRGGLVAYLAAGAVQPAALVLVDPVSGGGPPWAKPDPLPPVGWTGPALVLGCALGGHCAPEGRNHEVFAAALNTCEHHVVPDCGHGDMLDGTFRTFARLLCSRGSDPDRARAAVAERVTVFLRSDGLRDRPTAE
jgi:pimeloyl-ACP methyl ester carboxylesterase